MTRLFQRKCSKGSSCTFQTKFCGESQGQNAHSQVTFLCLCLLKFKKFGAQAAFCTCFVQKLANCARYLTKKIQITKFGV